MIVTLYLIFNEYLQVYLLGFTLYLLFCAHYTVFVRSTLYMLFNADLHCICYSL